MTDPITSGPPAGPADPGASIPSLVEAYRRRRDALRAQMDGLSALQDDIRTAASREGREIIEQARRDVRQTILEARQRLLTLADEVQAALDAELRAVDGSRGQPDGRSAPIHGPHVAGTEALGDLHLDLGAILEWSEPDLATLDNDVKELAAVLASPLDAQLVVSDPYGFPSEAFLLADPADPSTESAAVTPVEAGPIAPPASPASSGTRLASPVGPPARSVAPSGRPQPDARPLAPGPAAPAATELPAPSEPRHAARPFDAPERERHPSGHGEPSGRQNASPRPPSSNRSGEFPAVPAGSGSAAAATAAPRQATDLSALVTEIVAHGEDTRAAGLSRGEVADPDDPPAPRPSRSWRAEALFTAAAMPVSRGSRLVGWLAARGHLLPVAVGLVVTLMVIASWFRESPDPDMVPVDIALRSEEAGAGEGGSAERVGESPVRRAGAEAPLRVEARREVWVQVTVDGRQGAGRTLRAGEAQSIAATREVVIRAGDAGALWVSFRGGAAEPLGPDGRVLTRSFPLGSAQGANLVGTGSRGPDQAPSSASAATATGAQASRAQSPVARARDEGPPEAQIVAAAERWFESYYRRLPYDAFGTSHRPSVADGRQPDSRLPEGIREVNRTFDNVQVQVVADTAVYSARMTERGQAGEVLATHASRVSQVWVRRGTGWQLMDVKLLGDSSSPPR
jgi:hypothetical protein